MTLTEVLPNLKQLSRTEKLRVVHILIDEIAAEETTAAAEETELNNLLESGRTYEIWSPYDSFDAAAKLNQLLEEHKANG
ncbi:MAG: hypothetical protein LH472_10710 [Pyrinomonadaceae bacterium]|nr:hypothetical protein [Pyrinomonadaceae bacterium]